MRTAATFRIRRRGAARVGVRVLAGLLMTLTAAGIAYPLYWNHRAETGGAVLLDKALLSSARTCPTSVNAAAVPPSGQSGVLEIPAIGLVAPVLNGLSDAVLNVAIGHVPVAPWPSQVGESMLEAHDVSYFADLSSVRPGDLVIWLTTCLRAEFRVQSTYQTVPGAIVDPPSNGAGLALVTCWPTDALYWTSQRYVVTTRLVDTVRAKRSLPKVASVNTGIKLGAPPALQALGLDLGQNTNYLALGVLHLAGSVRAAWAEGPGPLAVEREAIETYFGAEKAHAAHNLTWWHDLAAPGVAFPASWPSFGEVNITITMRGSKPTAVAFSSAHASAHFVVSHSTMLLAGLS